VISGFFASLTLAEVVVLANVSPTSKMRIPIEFTWDYGLFWSAIASVFGVIVATRLGGPLPRRNDQKEIDSLGGSVRIVQRSRHETLH
jgi:hypothetical protein